MKFLLAPMLSALFIFGLSASAFAIHAEIPSETQAVVATGNTQVTLNGEVRVRGWYLQNYSGVARSGPGTPADVSSQSWYDERLRLGVKAEVSKNTTGFILIESSPEAAGPNVRLDVFKFGGATNTNTLSMNTKPLVEPTFLEAWILHKGSGLLGIPAGIKAGHQPLAIGEKQFLDHTKFGDDAIVLFADPAKELHVELWTAKYTEFTSTASNAKDTDSYTALATYKIDKNNTVGLNYTYILDRSDRTTVDSSGVPKPSVAIYTGSLQDIGLHANGKIAGLSYKGEFDFQFGDVPSYYSATKSTYNGYGALISLGYNYAPVNIRGEFAIGSGDVNSADNKNSEFQVSSGNDVHYSFIYEYTTKTSASHQQENTSGGRSTGIANTTYYRLGLDYSPLKDLTASLDGFILRATKVASGSKDIGSEVDLSLAYKIDRNLVYFVNAGYLSPGQWWIDNAGVTPANNKGITQAVHGITLKF